MSVQPSRLKASVQPPLSPRQRRKFPISTMRPFVVPVGEQDPHRGVIRMSLYSPEPEAKCAAAQKKATVRIREHNIKQVYPISIPSPYTCD